MPRAGSTHIQCERFSVACVLEPGVLLKILYHIKAYHIGPPSPNPVIFQIFRAPVTLGPLELSYPPSLTVPLSGSHASTG